MLCFHCLQTRLGRPLDDDDLTETPNSERPLWVRTVDGSWLVDRALLAEEDGVIVDTNTRGEWHYPVASLGDQSEQQLEDQWQRYLETHPWERRLADQARRRRRRALRARQLRLPRM
jgi:hypothetical protein